MAVSQWNFSKGYGESSSRVVLEHIPHHPCIDNTTPIGPVLVAAHAFPDPQTVPLKTTVNGKVLQDGTTAYVIYSLRSSPHAA